MFSANEVTCDDANRLYVCVYVYSDVLIIVYVEFQVLRLTEAAVNDKFNG